MSRDADVGGGYTRPEGDGHPPAADVSASTWQVIEADCVAQMKLMPEESVDAIVTDPPYGLEFMGKEWDRLWDSREDGEGQKEEGYVGSDGVRRTKTTAFSQHTSRGPTFVAGKTAQEWHQAWATEALRVLKPGGHAVVAGGTRTFHRLVCALEDAGFEIRDCIAHMFGSGFPKSLNIGEGRGTALKPSFEPWTLARKPLIGTVRQNVSEFGTGALNIDASRIQAQAGDREDYGLDGDEAAGIGYHGLEGRTAYERPAQGRWPPNVALSHLPECEDEACAESCVVAELDRQSGERPGQHVQRRDTAIPSAYFGADKEADVDAAYGDTGGASRFFATFSDADVGGERVARNVTPGQAEHHENPSVPTADVSARFRYTAKASRAERSKGVVGDVNRHPT